MAGTDPGSLLCSGSLNLTGVHHGAKTWMLSSEIHGWKHLCYEFGKDPGLQAAATSLSITRIGSELCVH